MAINCRRTLFRAEIGRGLTCTVLRLRRCQAILTPDSRRWLAKSDKDQSGGLDATLCRRRRRASWQSCAPNTLSSHGSYLTRAQRVCRLQRRPAERDAVFLRSRQPGLNTLLARSNSENPDAGIGLHPSRAAPPAWQAGPQGAAKPVHAPRHHHIEFTSRKCLQQIVEPGAISAVLGAGNPGILESRYDFPSVPLCSRHQLPSLIACRLLACGHSQVERHRLRGWMPTPLGSIGGSPIAATAHGEAKAAGNVRFRVVSED